MPWLLQAMSVQRAAKVRLGIQADVASNEGLAAVLEQHDPVTSRYTSMQAYLHDMHACMHVSLQGVEQEQRRS
jgi:hypothetical protein